MQHKKHKRKMNHVVIVTSDAADAAVKQIRIRPWLLRSIILILCVIIGTLIGFISYEKSIWETAGQKAQEQNQALEVLEEEKQALEVQVATLSDKIQILSETVNQKVQTENELSAQLEKQSTPTEFPLNSSAAMTEVTEGDPMCIFTASTGSAVVATASGTVTAVNDDETYGYSVLVDHGNGYVTVYRNQGEAMVKQGDSVVQGTTLFVIGEENTTLGYQMMKDGAYINPMDMLAISG